MTTRFFVPLQIKVVALLLVTVLVPFAVAAYFVGDISKAASNVAAGEAQTKINVLQKSMQTYEAMINGFNYKVSVLRQAIGGKP